MADKVATRSRVSQFGYRSQLAITVAAAMLTMIRWEMILLPALCNERKKMNTESQNANMKKNVVSVGATRTTKTRMARIAMSVPATTRMLNSGFLNEVSISTQGDPPRITLFRHPGTDVNGGQKDHQHARE